MSLVLGAKRLNENLSELQLKGDVFTRQMVLEKKRILDLEEAIIEADKQISAYQKNLQGHALEVLNLHTANPTTRADGYNPSRQGEVAQSKLVHNLENRLNQLLVRLSRTESENTQIKMKIDQFRRQRHTCNTNRKNLEVHVASTQEKVARLLENSALIKDVHTEIVIKQENEVLQNAEEQKQFTRMFGELGDYIEVQNNNFEQSVKDAAAIVKGQLSNEEAIRGELTLTQEAQINDRLQELAVIVDAERRNARETGEKIDSYLDGFDKLRVAAKKAAIAAGATPASAEKLDDIDEIKLLFVKNQDETFSIFKYIQEQIEETDGVLERIARIDEDYNAYEKKMGQEEAFRADTKRELHVKTMQTVEQTSEYMHSAQEAQRTVEKLAKKVQSLFYKIQCDQVGGKMGGREGPKTPGGTAKRSDSQLLLAGGGGGVNESNILKFMELIEQRAVEIIADFTKKMSQRDQLQLTPVLSSGNTFTGADMVAGSDILNSLVDDDGDEVEEVGGDGGVKPLCLNEMRRQTAEKLMRSKAHGGASQGGGGGGVAAGEGKNTRASMKNKGKKSKK